MEEGMDICFRLTGIYCEDPIDAGFRPGSRATFVSAKVAKTVFTQVSHICIVLTQVHGGRPNSLRSNKVRLLIWAAVRLADLQVMVR